jgi:hypothetical protein
MTSDILTFDEWINLKLQCVSVWNNHVNCGHSEIITDIERCSQRWWVKYLKYHKFVYLKKKYFWDSVLLYSPGWSWTHFPPASVSLSAEILDVHHQAWLKEKHFFPQDVDWDNRLLIFCWWLLCQWFPFDF